MIIANNNNNNNNLSNNNNVNRVNNLKSDSKVENMIMSRKLRRQKRSSIPLTYGDIYEAAFTMLGVWFRVRQIMIVWDSNAAAAEGGGDDDGFKCRIGMEFIRSGKKLGSKPLLKLFHEVLR